MIPILISMAIGASLATIVRELLTKSEQALYLAENRDMKDSLKRLAAENERLRNIVDQPEGACVQLVQFRDAPVAMH